MDSMILCIPYSGVYIYLLQFYDMKELFRTGGEMPDTNYVFMVCCFIM
jgi:hypothetical protein